MRRTIATTSALLLTTALTAAPVVAQQAEIGEAEVNVLDPGAEPRQLLRYEFAEGGSDTIRVDMGMTMGVAIDGVDMMSFDMPMSMTTTMTVTDVYDDGSARVEYVISDWDLGEMPFLGADTGELEAAVEMLDGFGGWMVVDTRGAILDAGLDIPDEVPVELAMQSEGVATEVEVLPEEPVGVGARWESTMSTLGGGVEMEMVSTSEIVSIDGDVIVLDQEFTSGLMPDFGDLMGLGLDLGDSFMESEVSGGGTSELRLDRVAQPGEMEVAVDMTMGLDDGERMTEMTYGIVMDIVATLVE